MNTENFRLFLPSSCHNYFDALKEDLFRLAFEGTNNGLWYYDMSLDQLYFSPHVLKLLGYEEDRTFTGEEAWKLLLGREDSPVLGQKLLSTINDESFCYDGEVRIKTVSGDWKWLRVRSKLISRSDDGALKGFAGTYEDITGRKKSEEDLLKGKREFMGYFDSASVGMSVNAPDRYWVEVNQELCRILGYSKEELISKTWLELTHPDDKDISIELHRKALNGVLDNYKLDKRFIRKDGKIVYVRLSVCTQRKYDGSVDYFIASYVDETERHKSEEYFRTLIEISPYGVIISDLEGFPTFISQKAKELFRIPGDVQFNKLWIFGFVVIEDREHALASFNDSINGINGGRKFEYKCKTYDNNEIWIEVISSPVLDDAQTVTGLMLMCNDISIRKIAEQELLVAKNKAEQSDNFKTSLIRNISHEIRTPLNAILGFSELMADRRIPAEEKEGYVDIMNASSDQLLNTIDNLVNISAIEAKITSVTINETDLDEILNGIYNQFHKKAFNKHIRFLINNNDPAEKIRICTDRMRLYQILSHLVSNAIKYTWYGQVTVGYALRNGMIEFYVIDTGIGIPHEFHSRVFDNFFQIEDSCNGRPEGIGLGLPICKAYVELLGGRIWLSSEPGRGSSFFFTVPYNCADANVIDGGKPSERPVRNYKILVVDDLEPNRRYLEELFRLQCIDVRSAGNGLEALEICKADSELDVVLMDIKMPVMDGIEAAAQIKAIRPSLVLIAQSAFLNEKDHALKAGFDDFISKPFTRHQIISEINKHMVHKQ